MRKLEAPDWGYFGAAWGIAAVGLGLVFMSADLAMAGVIITALGLALLVFSLRSTLTSLAAPLTLSSPPLTVHASLEHLNDAYPAEFSVRGAYGRVFLLVSVRNEGRVNLKDVVARILLSEQDEAPCFWSREPGHRFVPVGTHSVDINVFDSRSLVVAQVFGEDRLWARLPVDPAMLFDPHLRATRINSTDIVRFRSGDGRYIDIGSKADITIVFRSERLEWKETYAVGFDSKGKPTVRKRD